MILISPLRINLCPFYVVGLYLLDATCVDALRDARRIVSLMQRVVRAVGVDGPLTASLCQNEVVADLKHRRPSVDHIIRIGMDTSKHVFQLHGVNAAEEPVLRKKLRRQEMITFFTKLAPTVIGIEACGGSHHWALLLQSLGHQVKMLPPQFVKPYLKRGKNDAADAEARLARVLDHPDGRSGPTGWDPRALPPAARPKWVRRRGSGIRGSLSQGRGSTARYWNSLRTAGSAPRSHAGLLRPACAP
jgi:hypothetical protein